MNKFFKRITIGIVVITSLLLVGYGAYKVYDMAVEDAARRIKQSVTEGVAEGAKKGIRSGVGSVLNPLNWFGGLFGRKNKKKPTDQPTSSSELADKPAQEAPKTTPADEEDDE